MSQKIRRRYLLNASLDATHRGYHGPMDKPTPITCAKDCDHWQYDTVQTSDESTREGSEDPDMY